MRASFYRCRRKDWPSGISQRETNAQPPITGVELSYPGVSRPHLNYHNAHLKDARLVQSQQGTRHHLRQALRAVLDYL